jgi:hypothetical protein
LALFATAALLPVPGRAAATATVIAQAPGASAVVAHTDQASAGQPAQTRQGQLRKLREERARQELQPHEPNFLERQLLVMEDPESRRLMDTNFWGFYPRAQFISRGSNLGLGVRFWRHDIRGRTLDIHGSAFYSLSKYQFYDFQIGRIPHQGTALPLRSWKGDDVYELGKPGVFGSGPVILYGSLRYRHLPQEDFYGLGPDSSLDNRTAFLQNDGLVELVAGYRLLPWLVIAVRSGFRDYFIGSGEDDDLPSIEDIFDDTAAPGLTQQPNYFHATGQILLDTRDEPGNPHRGLMVGADLSRYLDLDGGSFNFNRFAFDARGFLPLGSPQRVVALRTLLYFDDPDDGAEVPFYMMESLGGSHTLRGYNSFRFRDEKVVLFQAEYRWEAAPPVEIALFADAGTVAASVHDLDLSAMKTDYGAGLRIKNFRATIFRLDYARSEEGGILLFRFSSSF